jgi:glyoxylate/hydroxypyruvate reductase A
MELLFISPADDPVAWKQALTALVPDLNIRVWPDTGDVEGIDVALVWKPPPGELKRFPNLKLIASLGMGVDHILRDPELPADVPIARLLDDNIITQMSEYVCLAVLRYHRALQTYERFQQERRWQPLPAADTSRRQIGILGLGAIGRHTASSLLALGFPVLGWSRTTKALKSVECFYGSQGLAALLQRSNMLVCLLPLTAATKGIINAETLALLPAGAYLINCARGEHVVENALLAALDKSHIAGATLDVFQQEPLPPDHPFWTHPKVLVTPHIAGLTSPSTAAPQVAENIRRIQAGQPILNQVDRNKGY